MKGCNVVSVRVRFARVAALVWRGERFVARSRQKRLHNGYRLGYCGGFGRGRHLEAHLRVFCFPPTFLMIMGLRQSASTYLLPGLIGCILILFPLYHITTPSTWSRSWGCEEQNCGNSWNVAKFPTNFVTFSPPRPKHSSMLEHISLFILNRGSEGFEYPSAAAAAAKWFVGYSGSSFSLDHPVSKRPSSSLWSFSVGVRLS